MSKQLTYTFVKEYIESFDLTLLSKRYLTQKTKLKILCKCDREWTTTWRSFKQSKKCCPYCARLRGTIHPNTVQFTDEEKAARNPALRLKAFKIWEAKVLQLNDNKCCITGKKTKKSLVAHHLENWADNPELREDPKNGVILTKVLHTQFHSEYGHKSTKKDFIEFWEKLIIKKYKDSFLI